MSRHKTQIRKASWRSGYAEDCKSLYGGSIPSEASNIPRQAKYCRKGVLMIDFVQLRRNMIESQLRPCDVNDVPLLKAMEAVPRELFVPKGREAFAYIDQNIPVSEGSDRRFMLQPMIIGRMIQALELLPGDKVLEIACGLGYASAVMAELGATVVAVESDGALAAAARERLAGWPGAKVLDAPLNQGAPGDAPFDAILINGAIETMPDGLLDQLKDSGRLVAIESGAGSSRVILHTRAGASFGKREILDVSAPVLSAFHRDSTFIF